MCVYMYIYILIHHIQSYINTKINVYLYVLYIYITYIYIPALLNHTPIDSWFIFCIPILSPKLGYLPPMAHFSRTPHFCSGSVSWSSHCATEEIAGVFLKFHGFYGFIIEGSMKNLVNSLGGSMSKIPVKHAVCNKAEVCFGTGVAPELSAPCCLSKNI